MRTGLTPFGKDVVRELNRLGVMVDISHVADKTFYDAIEVSRAPVVASHSSCRAIDKHPRNMTDDMLRALAKNGGVVMINYEVSFLSEEYRVASDKATGGVVVQLDLDGAAAKFEDANQKGPHWADPLKAWGDVLAKQGKTKEELAKYDEALKYAPNWKQLKDVREAAAKQKT